MRAQLHNLFARYQRAHLRLEGCPQQIRDETGALIGHVDQVWLSEGVLRVAGWANAARLRLVLAKMEAEAVPSLHRPDVSPALGGSATTGFELSLPCDRGVIENAAAPRLIVTAMTGHAAVRPISIPIPIPPTALWRLRLAFLRDLACITPEIIRWLRTRDPVWRGRVKAKLGLGPQPFSAPLGEDLFSATTTSVEVPAQPLTIVLPVHNAFALVQDCLRRVEVHTDLPCRLILVEDASTDPRIRPFLRDWAKGRDWVELVENDENLGFIGSVNRGLDRALAGPEGGPVVLLNSDALLPSGWARRIVAPFADRPEVASVTPMSNDAEICSVPVICRRLPLIDGQANAIDILARRLNPGAVAVEVPTGVGFCMAVARDWLCRVGKLDPIFGRGYGEEVDWCQRVRAEGGVHLALGNLFVEHRGGESFGQVEKSARIAESGRIITRRWPDFDLSVQHFIGADPLRGARLALGLAWAGGLDSDRPVPVYLAHSMGGGAELYLQDRIGADLEQGRPSVVLRVGGRRQWRLELVTPQGITHGESDEADTIRQLLACLQRRRIVYSCAVGAPDPVAIPDMLLSLLGPEAEAELLFHDYFPLSPDYTLLGTGGIYCGPVRAPTSDPAHTAHRPDGHVVELQEWQDAWRRFACRAAIVTFSTDSARHVGAVWPDLVGRIHVRPHRLSHVVPSLLPPPAGERAVIGVLGNIGRQKGAGVLRELSQRLSADTAGPGLVLIGNIDPTYRLAPPAVVHGSYAIADLPQLVRRYGITHWLIPSIWPETFCYAVHEALATGLPVMAFDIGAQGEAVGDATNGILLAHGDGRDLAGRVLSAIGELTTESAPPLRLRA